MDTNNLSYPVNEPEPTQPSPAPVKPISKFKQFFITNKKKILIITPIVIVLIIAVVVWFIYVPASKTQTASTDSTTIVTPPKPTTVASPLTGVQVTPDAATKPVVGIMIENLYPDARPQSGLGDAGVVYEALAEGGITRFLAIFQEPVPSIIGPIRSLRPYYLRWGLEYNIPVVHAGGSQPALADIGKLGMKNIDALAYDGSYFYRATDRLAPHNLYSKTDMIANIVSKLKFDTAPTFTLLLRKVDAPNATATHPKINITFGADPAYNVEYTYDPNTNTYARNEGGKPQLDRNTNQQIAVKNVVVEFTPTTYAIQPDGKPETDINLIGTGKALIFLDGNVTIGTWSKTTNTAQTQILDSTGAAVQFNPGNTWYSVIPVGNSVIY